MAPEHGAWIIEGSREDVGNKSQQIRQVAVVESVTVSRGWYDDAVCLQNKCSI